MASLKESYVANPLNYTEKLTKKDKERLSRFFDKVKSSVGILNKLYNTTITALEENELRYFFLNYVNGFQSDQGLRDLVFDNKLHIGDNHYSIFSISDSSYLPDTITNVSVKSIALVIRHSFSPCGRLNITKKKAGQK